MQIHQKKYNPTLQITRNIVNSDLFAQIIKLYETKAGISNSFVIFFMSLNATLPTTLLGKKKGEFTNLEMKESLFRIPSMVLHDMLHTKSGNNCEYIRRSSLDMTNIRVDYFRIITYDFNVQNLYIMLSKAFK